MKRFLIMIIELSCLIFVADAIPQTYDIPNSLHRVSFDMNTSEKLNVTFNPTENGETLQKIMYTLDSIDIKGESGTAGIIIVFYLSATGMDMSNMQELIGKTFREFHCGNLYKMDKEFKIDGTTGLLVSGSRCQTPTSKAFLAHYNPNLMEDPGNSINCIIWSTFPWDKGTRDLLNSIQIDTQHITKKI